MLAVGELDRVADHFVRSAFGVPRAGLEPVLAQPSDELAFVSARAGARPDDPLKPLPARSLRVLAALANAAAAAAVSRDLAVLQSAAPAAARARLQAVREGLASATHPGIVFKPGPAGRRAALAGGPDVWEIVAALRHTTGSESERVAVLAEQFGVHERQVAIALNYAAAHRAEIEAWVDANDRALAQAESVAGERQRLLA